MNESWGIIAVSGHGYSEEIQNDGLKFQYVCYQRILIGFWQFDIMIWYFETVYLIFVVCGKYVP